LHENLERILPDRTRVLIEQGSWPVPPLFGWLKQLGNIPEPEMHHVFNMGIGMVLVVNDYFVPSIRRMLLDSGLESWTIGEVVEGAREVVWK
jgi:phosphoribosylformylglycinamidine cyclo-ligase